MSSESDDELADLLGELADTLRELESQVRPGRRRRGPLGLPAPPSPREVLTFTGEYAIPTAIAVLQANVKILELVGAALRAGDTAIETRQRGSETVDRIRGETVSQLDRALTEIQRAIEEGDLPRTPEARNVVEEARRLNADLREYVRDADETVERERQAERRAERRPERRGREIPIEDGSDDEQEDDLDDAVEIDVEEELQSIKEGMGEGEDGDDESGEDDGDDSEGSEPSDADGNDLE